MVFDKKVFK